MKKITSALLASAIVATSAVTFSVPAAADPGRDRYVEQYYNKHNRDDDYWRWKKNRNKWDEREYRSWYRERHRDRDNDAAAAGLFGLAAGAIIGGALSQNASSSAYSENDRYCASRYRSYDPVSNTIMGYDGFRHPCP